MGKLVYQFGIFLVKSFLHTHALFNKKSKLAVEGRKNLFQELEIALKGRHKPLVWFHCASLGEFEQGRPLIEAFKKNYPEYCILLTFFSPSGYEVKKNYEQADFISYMPLDSPANAKRFVKISQPKMAFFIKYEFWYFHLKALTAVNCWTFSVSAIFRSEQVFFKFYGKFYRKLLKEIDHFFVQNETSASLLKGIGIYNISITGDTRFDRVNEIVRTIQPALPLSEFASGHQVLLGGSTWEPDIKVIAPFLQQHPEWRAIIAPHDISEENLRLHERILNIHTIRLSKIKDKVPEGVKAILIDNIGMLSKLYQYGNVAFIGGAFGAGLHNTLEAACFGLPIFFGNKNYLKFQEANQLLETGAALMVKEGNDFNIQLDAVTGKNQLEAMSEKARTFVNANLGATDKILQHITPLIHQIEKS